MAQEQIGFVNGRELKKGDKIEYQIRRLAGKDYDPPILHRGTVVNPNLNYKYGWVVQIDPENKNRMLPEWELNAGLQAIYGDLIVKIL